MSSAKIDEGLICREYKSAADKNKQVGILAELNDCSKEVILEILSRNGAISGVPIKKKTEEASSFSGAKPAYSSKGFKWTAEADAEVSRLSKEGLLLKEIAERMGISVQSIYSRRKYLSSLGKTDKPKKRDDKPIATTKSNDNCNERKAGLDVMTTSEKVISLLKDAGWKVECWNVNVIDGTFVITGGRTKEIGGMTNESKDTCNVEKAEA